MSGELLWYFARAGGFVAYGLLTASVAMGLLASLRVTAPGWTRAMTTEVHRFVTMTALGFTALHVLTLVAHPTEGYGITEVLIPFAAAREPLWTGLGVIAMELAVAVWLTTHFRQRIGYGRWRQLHYLAFVSFGAALVHGIAQGTDTATPWGRVVYMASMGLVGGLLAVRIFGAQRPAADPEAATATRPAPVAARAAPAPARAVTTSLPPLPERPSPASGGLPPLGSAANTVRRGA
ncbi:MAG: ferric reductase-like transmembrane domain-containing protein [Thermoleophilia bacterium]|nr:ferric reductase-like transmembrane domain-containing protein [Thermoleophilia bacterium]